MQQAMNFDDTTFSNYQDVQATNYNLDLKIDFDLSKLTGEVDISFKVSATNPLSTLTLD